MAEDKKSEEAECEQPDGLFGVRHVQYLLYFIAGFFAYALRISFNVGIIAMITDDPPSENIPTYPEWSSQKNVMLSAFFWGYVCTQLIGGQLAAKFGPRWFLAATYFTTSLFSLLIPVFGEAFGYEGVIACRVIQGLSQGFLFPCIQHLMGKWSPVIGRAKAAGFSFAGVALGTVVAMPVTGLICNSGSLGWPVAYYFFGACGILWTICWILFGADSPAHHKFISEHERHYISSGIDPEYNKEIDADKKIPTPWLSILTSLPFWAILVTDCGFSWGYWTLLTEIPSYMQSVLNFDIASNSLLSALPYFVRCMFIVPFGFLSDYLIARRVTTVTASRRIFTSMAMFGPAICLAALSFVESTERVITITILVIGVTFTAGIFSGYLITQVDLSPNHAGTIMGICNTASNFFSLLAPLSVDLAIHITGYQETDKELWTIIFCTASVILVGVGLFFVFAGSGDVQAWNKPIREQRDEEVEKGEKNEKEENHREEGNEEIEDKKESKEIKERTGDKRLET